MYRPIDIIRFVIDYCFDLMIMETCWNVYFDLLMSYDFLLISALITVVDELIMNSVPPCKYDWTINYR